MLARLPLCAVAFLLVNACRDLAHVNPYDPEAPFDITLSGPELGFVGDTLTFTAETKPVWTWPQPPEWSSLNSRVLFPLGEGRYVARADGTATIQVRFGPRFATRQVLVFSSGLRKDRNRHGAQSRSGVHGF